MTGQGWGCERMSDVFISYARSTRPLADAAAEALRGLGYEVWLDALIPAHRAYDDVIEERLKLARAVLVLWSPDAAKSTWVRSEAGRGRAAGKLVQAVVAATPLPMPYDMIQCADLEGWDGDPQAAGWRTVVASLAELIGGAPVAESPAGGPAAPAPALPDKPSIAVLPFTDMADGATQDFFTEGMAEEITNALTRFPGLFVIASSSAQAYRAGARDVKVIGRELGVRYLLEGSVRKAAGRVRIAVKLVAARDGAQIWTERFDDTLEDVFALQDRVAASVAGALDSTLETAEISRAAARPAATLGAYELYLRALPLSRAWDRAAAEQALRLLEAAIADDAAFAPAYILAGFVRGQILSSGWADDPAECHRLGIDHCRRALRLAPNDPMVLSLAATALPALGENLGEAGLLAERALEINPGSAGNLMGSGWLQALDGDPELAISRLEAARRLDPRSPMRLFNLTGIGIAWFSLRRFEDAAALLSEVAQAMPDYPIAQLFLAACLAHLGRLAPARAALDRVEAMGGADRALSTLREPGRRALLQSGLALARGSAAA